MTDNIVVLGASGQVGRALNQLLDDAVFLGRDEADLAKPDSLAGVLEALSPTAVINAAAYTQVDKAEEESALAEVINADAPLALARFCAEKNIPFVHYSTDYVFDGSGERGWQENDQTNPINAYGRTKLLGECYVAEAGGQYLIFRTSWVYDAYGKNFVNTMLRLGGTHKELRVVADQFGAPSYAPHLARATVQALESGAFQSGIYHMCNAGETSWHGFAEAIFAAAKGRGEALQVERVTPIATAEYPTPAKRPHNSRLDCGKLQRTFGISLPDWREGLKECMEIRFARP